MACGSRRSTRSVQRALPGAPAQRRAYVPSIGVGRAEAGVGAVVAGLAVAEHVVRALDGLHLAQDGGPGVGAVDDQAQPAGVGVDEPRPARRLGERGRPAGAVACSVPSSATQPSSLVAARAAHERASGAATRASQWNAVGTPLVADAPKRARTRPTCTGCANAADHFQRTSPGRPVHAVSSRPSTASRASSPEGSAARTASTSGVRRASSTLVRSCATTSAPADAWRECESARAAR